MLECAALAFAHEAEGDEQDDHDLQENGDEAGNEEVCRASGGVVEDGGADFDGQLRGAEDAVEGLFESDSGGGVDGLSGDGGVGAVDEDENGRGGAVLELTGVVVRDFDSHACFAGAHGGVHFRVRLDGEGEAEGVGGGEAFEELAALLGVRLVEDYGGNLTDVGVDCEAEEEELDEWDEESEEECAGVADDVRELFAADGPETVEEGVHFAASMIW